MKDSCDIENNHAERAGQIRDKRFGLNDCQQYRNNSSDQSSTRSEAEVLGNHDQVSQNEKLDRPIQQPRNAGMIGEYSDTFHIYLRPLQMQVSLLG